MPTGGGYSAHPEAFRAFSASIKTSPNGIVVNPLAAQPTFCSAATYVIFLKTLIRLQKDASIHLSQQNWNALLARSQPDGTGIWGRWNANGPGTACLFHELNAGKNFTDFEKARPGDFVKFFWSTEVGKSEHGHSAVYLGSEMHDGIPTIRFWSSNVPLGYGEKSVPRKRIALAIFSRLTNPQNIGAPLAPKNDYLASLLSKRSNFKGSLEQCGATTP